MIIDAQISISQQRQQQASAGAAGRVKPGSASGKPRLPRAAAIAGMTV
ncbi:MAG TPA: hypothetical protein PL061_13060 [Syntrophales bacterium]|nr:hypothetical protein [Syntrophales bacterium]